MFTRKTKKNISNKTQTTRGKYPHKKNQECFSNKKEHNTMKKINLACPKNIKGSYKEADDLMAKEYYWLTFKKYSTFAEMKIWHHAFMEIYLRRTIGQEEADEWFVRGHSYFDIQANSDIQKSRGKGSEIKLKALEQKGKQLAFSEKDEQILETAKTQHIIKREVYDAIREKTTKQPEPCRVFKEISFTLNGTKYKGRIEI